MIIPGAVNLPTPLRGATRLLFSLGHAVLAEVPLKNGRRADLLSLDPAGSISIVEVKSGLPDFRSDHKWRDYLAWCDRFYFAVGPDFPLDVLPEETGLIISDLHDGILYRECPVCPLSPARRRALILRFAHLAAGRLMNRQDIFLSPL
jgi:hypothetical protein